MRFLIIILLIISIDCLGQRGNNQGRSFGIGAQVLDPTGINFQTFRGFFNNNNSSFATYGVIEVGVGKENLLGIAGEKPYMTGQWMKGGWRFDVNYLYPLITVHSPFVFQTYCGAGLQSGTRKYMLAQQEESEFATGLNLMIRIEFVTHGIDMGRDVWYFSIYSDIKYHTDFNGGFDYLTPVVGVRMRKGR